MNAKGRITLEEITGDDVLLRKKDLPRLLADPAFCLAADANEQRMVLMEIATVATMRANYNANVAHSLVYGNDFEKRQAAGWMASAQQAAATSPLRGRAKRV